MIMKCIKCHNPISAYPCKFCGLQADPIKDECPRKKGVNCAHTGKMCHKGIDYNNCEVLRKNS